MDTGGRRIVGKAVRGRPPHLSAFADVPSIFFREARRLLQRCALERAVTSTPCAAIGQRRQRSLWKGFDRRAVTGLDLGGAPTCGGRQSVGAISERRLQRLLSFQDSGTAGCPRSLCWHRGFSLRFGVQSNCRIVPSEVTDTIQIALGQSQEGESMVI